MTKPKEWDAREPELQFWRLMAEYDELWEEWKRKTVLQKTAVRVREWFSGPQGHRLVEKRAKQLADTHYREVDTGKAQRDHSLRLVMAATLANDAGKNSAQTRHGSSETP